MLGDVRKTPNLDTSRNLPKGCVMTRMFPGRETTSVKIKTEQEDQLPLVQGKWAGEWPLSMPGEDKGWDYDVSAATCCGNSFSK